MRSRTAQMTRLTVEARDNCGSESEESGSRRHQ